MSTSKDHRTVQSYLFFNGRCEEAIEFYRKAIGAEVEMILRFKDSPDPMPPGMLAPGFENKVMHSSFRVGQTTVMASDGCGTEKTGFDGFSLSLAVPTEAEADRYFAALADGGNVTMPLGRTFWSPRFGMLRDRFGIGWMINVVPPGQK
jgi:PhnB protein